MAYDMHNLKRESQARAPLSFSDNRIPRAKQMKATTNVS
jgi:hypothetical protein